MTLDKTSKRLQIKRYIGISVATVMRLVEIT